MTYHWFEPDRGRVLIMRTGDEGRVESVGAIDTHPDGPVSAAEIARATVAALNGKTAEPRTVWHPKAVEALRAVFDWYEGDNGGSVAPAVSKVREALALVDQPPPAEKAVGWTVMSPSRDDLIVSTTAWPTIETVRRKWPGYRIVRIVEEPDQ